MARAYAGEDAEVLAEIENDCELACEAIKSRFPVAFNTESEVVETITIFVTAQNKTVDLTIPVGAIRKSLLKYKNNELLKDNQIKLFDTISNWCKSSSSAVTAFVPGVFSRPRQAKSDNFTKEFKRISARIEMLKRISHMVQSFLDRPHPSDLARLQHFSSVVKSEL